MKNSDKCSICEKEFFFYSSNRPRAKFCSNLCHMKNIAKKRTFWANSTYEEKLDNLRKRYEAKVIRTENDCWDWLGALDDGYGQLRFHKAKLRAHRASWILHKGNILNNISVLHSCDNRKCTNPEHLFLGSRADNNADMVKKGRNKFFKEQDNPRAILNNDHVKKIKELLRLSRPIQEIADQFKVARHIIYSIRSKKTWVHIE